MRLFDFPERPGTNAPYVVWYRWVLNFEVSRQWPGIGLEAAVEVKGAKDKEWRQGYDYRSISLTHRWLWGEQHFYYDGCHCCFGVGFLLFNWTNSDCKKCDADGFGPKV